MSVMNVKGGTSINPAIQQANYKDDGAKSVSAHDHQKAFGDKSVGDVLNQVADANWVDPKKKLRVAGDNQLDKDAFLKLMLAQMKHQDPTNPMQSHEMASQLAQFTSLEQLNNINSTLETMKNAQSPSTNYQALALIGKRVTGDSSKLTRAVGDTKHAFNFELMGDANTVKLTVMDTAGNKVRELEFRDLKKGQNAVEWNGLNAEGMAARPGEYKIAVEGLNSSGAKVHSKTAFSGKITGLNYTSEGPVLIVGSQTVKLSDVRKIEDATLEDQMQSAQGIPLRATEAKSQQIAPQSASPAAGKQKQTTVNATADQKSSVDEENIPAAEETDEKMVGNIEDVPMSREMLTKLAKLKKD